MHFEGIFIAAAAILIIGAFHPIVIKTEYYFGKEAWPVFLACGVICTAGSLFMGDHLTSSILAVTGAGFLWGIRELFEQEERVNKGWWPDNPNRQ